jgi:hypothetical protein
MPYRDLVKKAYTDQKNLAKGRGIPFLLSFDEWQKIWNDSGHFSERGKKNGQYCMARFGDKGPYAVGNVEITLVEENNRDAVQSKRVNSPSVKVTPEIVREIRKLYVKNSRGGTLVLARKYGIHVNTVRDIVNRVIWKDI